MTLKEFTDKCLEITNYSYFEKYWSLGGTSCSYNGSTCYRDPDDEPDFDKLDDFLIAICPNIGFLQYKKILKCAEQDTKYYSDYYGGETSTRYSKIELEDLYNTLKDLNLI